MAKKRPSVFYVEGRHKSRASAKRHLRALQRKYRSKSVRIASRRNASGDLSGNGTYFRFSIRDKKKRPRNLAWLLSFSYTPAARSKKKGGGSSLKVDFIVAGPAKLRKSDAVERFGILIRKVVIELDADWKWIAVLTENLFENDNAEVDSSEMVGERPPRKAKIRSAYRNEKLIYEGEEAESE